MARHWDSLQNSPLYIIVYLLQCVHCYIGILYYIGRVYIIVDYLVIRYPFWVFLMGESPWAVTFRGVLSLVLLPYVRLKD